MIQPEDLERGRVQGEGGWELEAQGRRKENRRREVEPGEGWVREEPASVLEEGRPGGLTWRSGWDDVEAGDWRGALRGNGIREGGTERKSLSQAGLHVS